MNNTSPPDAEKSLLSEFKMRSQIFVNDLPKKLLRAVYHSHGCSKAEKLSKPMTAVADRQQVNHSTALLCGAGTERMRANEVRYLHLICYKTVLPSQSHKDIL